MKKKSGQMQNGANKRRTKASNKRQKAKRAIPKPFKGRTSIA